MQHIVGKEQRDLQAAKLHHLILHNADIRTGDGVKNRSHLAHFDHLADRFFRVIRADAYQTQLADFLVHGHFFQQVGNKGIPRLRGQGVVTKQFIRQRGLQRQTHGDAYSAEPFHCYLALSQTGTR